MDAPYGQKTVREYIHRPPFELYRIDEWGMGFFSISDDGHLVVELDTEKGHAVDLYEVMCGLDDRGISAPVSVGFPDLLKARMQEMTAAFAAA